jgi:hypothetical protein
VEKARAPLSSLESATESAAPPTAAEAPSPEHGAPLGPARYLPALVLVAACVGFVTLALPPSQTSRIEPAARKRGLLAIRHVDDDADPFAELTRETLPDSVTLHVEDVPTGPGRSARRSYLVVPASPETEEAARQKLVEAASPHLPSEDDLGLGWTFEGTERTGLRTYLLRGAPIATERDVAYASVTREARPFGGLQVNVQLNETGAARFEEATAIDLSRRMAIVSGDRVESTPVIQSRLSGGSFRITMGSGDDARQVEDARRLAEALGGDPTIPADEPAGPPRARWPWER